MEKNKLETNYLNVEKSKKWWLLLSIIYILLGTSTLFFIVSNYEEIILDPGGEIIIAFSILHMGLAFLAGYSSFSTRKSINKNDFNLEQYLILHHKSLRSTALMVLLFVIILSVLAFLVVMES